MAKSKDPSALTVNGADIVFAGHRAKISALIERAAEGTAEAGPDLELPEAAARVPRVAWPLLLGADEGVAAAQRAGDPRAMGPALLAALRRLAARATEAERREAARAAGEAARELLAPRYASPRGQDPERRARLRAELSRPVAVEETAAGAKLTGGPFGRLGVTLRMHGDSRLDWAAQSWALALAAHAPAKTPAAAKREGGGSRAEDLPAIVIVDGVVVAAADFEADALGDLLARAEAGEALAPHAGDAAAFAAEATRRRDDGQRLGAELGDLEAIDSADAYLPDVPTEDRALARRLAGELRRGPGSAPRLHAIRERVREALAPPSAGKGSRSIRYVTEPERRVAWARALAADARAEAEAAADLAEAAIVDAWAASPPGACGVLLAPGAPHPEDPWLAEVARSAARAELDALDALLTRPAPRARAAALRGAALPDRPGIGAEVLARVADARDEALGLRVAGSGGALRRHLAEALLSAFYSGPEGLAELGPGGVAVGVRLPVERDAWRVVTGKLPAVLAAGYVEIAPGPGGLPFAVAASSGSGDDPEDLRHAAIAWAIERWAEAGHAGEPPALADAVRAALADGRAPRPTPAKRSRKR